MLLSGLVIGVTTHPRGGCGFESCAVRKKIEGRHLGVMTWVWSGSGFQKLKAKIFATRGGGVLGFFSEDSLLSCSPLSFYIFFHSNYGYSLT